MMITSPREPIARHSRPNRLLRRIAVPAVLTATLPLLVVVSGDASAAENSPPVTADTTYTQVTQDGDNSGKTTLATCPQLCENNPNGERQAVVEFTVAGLPADAQILSAELQLSTWEAAPAMTTVHQATGGAGAAAPGQWAQRPSLGMELDRNSSAVPGANAWDVTAAVRGNGTVTLAVRQHAHGSRVYWASGEHSDTARHPRLVVSYETGTGPADWELVWRDEFDGTTLDSSRWRPIGTAQHPGYLDYDEACITDRPENLFVADGLLTLRAQRETMTCYGGGERHYTTAYLRSDPVSDPYQNTFQYGRFEIMAKSPNGPTNSTGLWPAFWLKPAGGGDGEIDVVELPGGTQHYWRSTAAVFRQYSPVVKADFRYDFPGDTYPGDGFHLYAIEWEPEEIRWYVDDVMIWRLGPDNLAWYDEVFHKPYHLRLNFQVGGSFPGSPDARTQFPADFQVDYVRVYQR